MYLQHLKVVHLASAENLRIWEILLSVTMLLVFSTNADSWSNNQADGNPPRDSELMAKLVDQLRIDFPSRRGVRLTQFGGMFADPERKSLHTVIEVLPDRSRWRTIIGQNMQHGQNNYLVRENLISRTQMIQCSSFGQSEFGIREYVPDKKLKSVPVLFMGDMEDAGAGRLARLELLFGMIPNRKRLVDLHSEKFVVESKIEVSSESDLLIHKPSGIVFKFNKENTLTSVTVPEYKVDSEGTLSPWFDWKFEPTDRRHDDGGLRGMQATTSDGKRSGLVFDHVIIEPLGNNETLQDFSIYKVKEGSKVSPVDDKLAEKFFIYSNGQAIFSVDEDAEREIESVLSVQSENSVEKRLDGDSVESLKRFSYLRSSSSAHCGLYSFAIAAAQLGTRVSLDDLINGDYTSDRKGSSVADLMSAATYFGLHAQSIRFADLEILAEIGKPAIIHSGNSYQIEGVSHWMTVLEVDQESRCALVADLPHKPKWLSESELLAWWDGTAILVSNEPIKTGRLTLIRIKAMFPILVVLSMLLITGWLYKKFCSDSSATLKLGSSTVLLLVVSFAAGASWQLLSNNSFLKNPSAVAMVKGKAFDQNIEQLEERWLWDPEWQSDSNCLILDARLPSDFVVAHVDGAVNLPPDCSLMELQSVWEKAATSPTIIVYCLSEKCSYSHQVASRFIHMGHDNVLIYRPGFIKIPLETIWQSDAKTGMP